MNVAICGAAALLPAIFLLRYFIKSDRFPEPTGVLVKTFFWGVAIVVPVVIAELAVQASLADIGGPATQALITSFLVAGLCEEGFKFLVLHRYCAQQSAFDEPMDAVVYGAVASLGFATLENIMYVSDGGIGVAVMRAFTAMPAHASFGAIMGYYYARAHFNKAPGGYLAALMVPVIVHGLYDAPLFLGGVTWINESPILGVGLILFFLGLLRWMYKKTRSIVTEMRASQDATG